MLRTDQTIIGLSSTCLRVATLRGRAIDQFERVFLDPAQWEELWSKGLRPLDEHVITLMRSLKIAPDSPATVFYHSPTVVAEVLGVATSVSGARQAAALAARESLTGDPGTWRIAQRVLGTDIRGSSVGPARTHILTVADQASAAESLAGLLSRAGLRLTKLVPTKGSLVMGCAASARQLPKEPRSAVVNLGDSTTIIASGDCDRLCFARCVEFGYGQLAEAMLRALRGNGSSEAMDRETAYSTLFRIGIPQRGQLIDTSRCIIASAVLPSMQSVLQRYVVEIRQSLRFAFKETELARANIYLTGPGASIPGLASSLSSQLDLAVERLEEATPNSREVETEEAFGDLSEAIEVLRATPTLAPSSLETGLRHKRVLSCTRIGIAAALAVLGGDAFLIQNNHARVKQALAELSPRVEGIRDRSAREQSAAFTAYSVNTAAKMIANHIGEHPNWTALMGDISRIAGPEIELTEVSAAYPTDAPKGGLVTLRGRARGGSNRDSLSTLIEALSASPLVASAKLISTRTDDHEEKMFQIAVIPKAVPIALPWEKVSAEGEAP